MQRSSWGLVGIAGIVGCFAAACATSGGDAGDDAGSVVTDSSAPDGKDASGKPATKDASSEPPPTTDDDASVTSDASAADANDGAAPPQPIVYGHSPDTLYAFDVVTNTSTEIGPFSGCTQSNVTQVIDLAIDSYMNAYATTFDGLYAVDLKTAACTLIKAGTYPNSLSFVPVGTLDPNIEALVGYSGSAYLRINVATGLVTSVGTLSGGYQSSGDLVSVAGGGTFLTVTGNGCGDCLLQVDPTTGDLVQSYGALPHGAVYGLAYWAGTLYGFDATGDLFSIGGGGDAGLTTTDLVVDGGVSWWGAGSTTIAPATAPDGGAIVTE